MRTIRTRALSRARLGRRINRREMFSAMFELPTFTEPPSDQQAVPLVEQLRTGRTREFVSGRMTSTALHTKSLFE